MYMYVHMYMHSLLSFNKDICLIFFFFFALLWASSLRNSSLPGSNADNFLYHLLRFIVFPLTYTFLTHVEFIFVYAIRQRLDFTWITNIPRKGIKEFILSH